MTRAERTDAERAPAIGVDIGGTKIAAGLVEPPGKVVRSVRAATPTAGGQAVLDTAATLIGDLAAGGGISGVGVGAPGIIDPVEGVVSSATDTVPGWAGVAVRAGLQRRTGLPAAVDNDVRVMALGEAAAGAGRDRAEALHLSVGTGIGGALLRNGRLVRGGHGSAGEVAHVLVPARGRIPCGCGRRDHLEAVVAGPAIAADYAARCGAADVPGLPEVASRMRAGDEDARTAITSAATLLGRCLAGMATAFDLDAVILGGGAAQIGAEFLHPLSNALRAEVRPPGRAIPVHPAQLGTDAPIIGAALLARETPAERT
ncbi:ROK family protein [Salinifilum aidingensis]